MSVLIAPLAEMEEDAFTVSEDELEALVSTAAGDEREAESTRELRLLYAAAEDAPPSTLPILATAGDVREVVQYLKKKPAGVSIVEAMDDVRRRVLEPRKLAAYEFWGIVERRGGDRLHLSALGWEFARKLAPEAEAYRAVLGNTAPYRAALEWMRVENHELVTHTQVAAYWREFYPSASGENQKATESSVVSFFHLCQAAEIGTMTIGKRGQPARLRVERDELAAFVEGRLTDSPTHIAPTGTGQTILPNLTPSPRTAVVPPEAAGQKHFLILCRRAARVVGRLEATLELLDIKSRAVIGNETDALQMSGEMLQAMRGCDAALVVVTPDDCQEDGHGGHTLDQNILIQINTAFVLYDRRILLLWNCRTPLPDSLSSLRHFTIEDDELTWEAGMQLMQVVKEFQAHAQGKRRQAC